MKSPHSLLSSLLFPSPPVLPGAAPSGASPDHGPHAVLRAPGLRGHGLRSRARGARLPGQPAPDSPHEADAHGPAGPADGAAETAVPAGTEAADSHRAGNSRPWWASRDSQTFLQGLLSVSEPQVSSFIQKVAGQHFPRLQKSLKNLNLSI